MENCEKYFGMRRKRNRAEQRALRTRAWEGPRNLRKTVCHVLYGAKSTPTVPTPQINGYRWIEGMEDLLLDLRKSGVEMHIITNYPVLSPLTSPPFGRIALVWLLDNCKHDCKHSCRLCFPPIVALLVPKNTVMVLYTLYLACLVPTLNPVLLI